MGGSLIPLASSFVGREAELAALGRLFSEDRRLVTIWGAGGMGKTRVALEYARRSGRDSCAVDLSESTSASGIWAAIAAALDVPLGPSRSESETQERIVRSLRRRGRGLLVLDNLEHLVHAAPEPLAALLREAPALELLVTSRERLRVPGETTFELLPLSLPVSASDLGASDAAALFLARTCRSGDDAVLAASDPRLAMLLVQLEGIPLAIELAAARLEVLGIGGIVERLPARLGLLSRGSRGVSDRQSTMRGAIAWSWDLLSECERDALAECAIFRGGFTVEAAERVLSVEPADGRVDLITALRDKSLLFIRRDAAGGPPRFMLYESVRAFALEKLLEGQHATETLARHDAYFLEVGGRWAARVAETGDVHARDLLARELDNLLEVHTRAIETQPLTAAAATRGLRALLASEPALETRVPARARLALWEATWSQVEGAGVAPKLLAELLGARGRALYAAGELDLAAHTLAQAVDLARDSAAEELEAPLHLDLGIVHHGRREIDLARGAYMRVLSSRRSSVDRRSVARALGNLGALHHDERRFVDARRDYERSLSAAAAIGDARVEGIMLTNLGVLEQEEQQFDRAHECFRRAELLLGQASDPRLAAITRGNLGMLHLERGALDDASRELGHALATLRAIDDAHSVGLTLARLGVASSLSGSREDALAALDDAHAVFGRLGDAVGLATVEVGRGFLDLGSAPSKAATVRAVMDRAATAAPGRRALVEVSDDARTMVRVLGRALERLERGAPPEADPDEDALVVGPAAASFRPPRGRWAFVGDHEAAHLVFARLVEHHRSRPGEGLTAAALAEIGWPGQRMRPESAKNRVYVVMAWLRKQGLGGLLTRGPAGYMIDPGVVVQRASKSGVQNARP